MEDRSWICQNLQERLFRQYYIQGVKGFINHVLSKPNDISEDKIRCSYVKYTNKKFHHKNIVIMHLLKKKFVEKDLYWFAHKEPYIPYETML